MVPISSIMQPSLVVANKTAKAYPENDAWPPLLRRNDCVDHISLHSSRNAGVVIFYRHKRDKFVYNCGLGNYITLHGS